MTTDRAEQLARALFELQTPCVRAGCKDTAMHWSVAAERHRRNARDALAAVDADPKTYGLWNRATIADEISAEANIDADDPERQTDYWLGVTVGKRSAAALIRGTP